MKRTWMLLFAGFLVLFLAACGGTDTVSKIESQTATQGPSSSASQLEVEESPQVATPSPDVPTPSPQASQVEAGKTVLRITVGGQTFTADLEDTAAAQALTEMLPMTLVMNDWQGVAKRFDLPSTFPESAQEVTSLNSGQLVLEGTGTLCLFYQPDAQGGSYTPLASVREADALEQAMEGEAVEVTFDLGTE